jgi:hypothetical protein
MRISSNHCRYCNRYAGRNPQYTEKGVTICIQYCGFPAMTKLFDDELHDAMQQLFDETIESLQLAKVSPDLDDLSATFAVALLKLGLATGFVEQKHPGFAKEVEVKRQRVIAALTQEQKKH